jgi:hypothetical protein
MFEKLIFPAKCKNFHPTITAQKSIVASHVMHNYMDKSNIEPEQMWNEKLKRNLKRPHYYHVICQDLIVEKQHDLLKVLPLEFCLTCH